MNGYLNKITRNLINKFNNKKTNKSDDKPHRKYKGMTYTHQNYLRR